MDDSDNCALRPDGTLKDASEIPWQHSPSDERPNPFDASQSVPSPSGTTPTLTAASPAPVGLSNKIPAEIVAGKRRIVVSSRFANGSREPSFFKSIKGDRETEGASSADKEPSGGSSNGDRASTTAKGANGKATTKAKASDKTSKNSTKRKDNPTALPSTAPAPKKHKAGAKEVQQSLATHFPPVASKKKSSQCISRPTAAKKRPTRIESDPESDEEVPASVMSTLDDTEIDDNDEEELDGEPEEEQESHDEGEDEDDGENMTNESGNSKKLKASFQVTKPVRKHAHRGNDPRTADIRLIMKKATENTKEGTRTGYKCQVCGDLMTGSTSTLRRHISRGWSTHGQIFLEKLEKSDITVDWLPSDEANEEGPAQEKLENVGIRVTSKWTKEGMLEHIIYLVVDQNLPFHIVDKKSFRRLLIYQRPATLESDIPKRTKLTQEIEHKAAVVRWEMAQRLKEIPGEISSTFDAWTSKVYDPYLGVTIHYIDNPPDQPNEWELKSDLLGLPKIEGDHGAANIAATLIGLFSGFGILPKMGWLTGDNVTINDKACRVFQKADGVDRRNRPWKAKQRRGRCMEHIVHLGAGAFIVSLNPKWRSKPSKTNADSVEEDEEGKESDDEEDEEWMEEWVIENRAGDTDEQGKGVEIDNAVEFDAGDLLGKLLALINQIRLSPQARDYFEKICVEQKLKPLQLVKWVRTRWGSMYDLVNRAVELRKAIDHFCALADVSGMIPKLKNKQYKDFQITNEEWKILKLVQRVLAIPRKAQATFSSEKVPTVARTLPTLDWLVSEWTGMSLDPAFDSVSTAIEKGLAKINKWHQVIESTHLYFICLALDPRVKYEYCRAQWTPTKFETGKTAFEKTFDDYARRYSQTIKQSSIPARPSYPEVSETSQPGMDFLQKALQSSQPSAPVVRKSRQELEDYLAAPREDIKNVNLNVVHWWGQHQSNYPVLSRMARDYLAIQGSSVASERAFSSGGLTATLLRNKLTPEHVEQIQLVKNGYKNGWIEASEEARKHEPYVWDEGTEDEETEDEK